MTDNAALVNRDLLRRRVHAAAFWHGVVLGCRDQIKRLIAEADTPAKRAGILSEVTELARIAERTCQKLEKLTHE